MTLFLPSSTLFKVKEIEVKKMVLMDVFIDQKWWVLLYLFAFSLIDLLVVDQGEKKQPNQ